MLALAENGRGRAMQYSRRLVTRHQCAASARRDAPLIMGEDCRQHSVIHPWHRIIRVTNDCQLGVWPHLLFPEGWTSVSKAANAFGDPPKSPQVQAAVT